MSQQVGVDLILGADGSQAIQEINRVNQTINQMNNSGSTQQVNNAINNSGNSLNNINDKNRINKLNETVNVLNSTVSILKELLRSIDKLQGNLGNRHNPDNTGGGANISGNSSNVLGSFINTAFGSQTGGAINTAIAGFKTGWNMGKKIVSETGGKYASYREGKRNNFDTLASGDVISYFQDEESNALKNVPLIGDVLGMGVDIARAIPAWAKGYSLDDVNSMAKNWSPYVNSQERNFSIYGTPLERNTGWLNGGKKESAENIGFGNTEIVESLFDRRREALAKAQTGYSIDEYTDLSSDIARYGFNSAYRADKAALDMLIFERATGADRNAISSTAGLFYQYRDKNDSTILKDSGGVPGTLKLALGGLSTSGLSNGRMNEFLNAMQSVMERGIEKGFSRSAEEVVADLNYLSKINNNSEMWSGQNAADKYATMSQSFSASTALSDTSQVMNYQVASELAKQGGYIGTSTGTYIDNMMALEKGITKDSLPKMIESIMKMEGFSVDSEGKISGNVSDGIERFVKMTGLGYTSAVELLSNYGKNNGKFTDEDIVGVRKEVDSKQDMSKALLTAEEDVRDKTALIAKELEGLKVNAIYNLMSKSDIFNKRSSSENLAFSKNQFSDSVIKGIKVDRPAYKALNQDSQKTYNDLVSGDLDKLKVYLDSSTKQHYWDYIFQDGIVTKGEQEKLNTLMTEILTKMTERMDYTDEQKATMINNYFQVMAENSASTDIVTSM